MKILVTGGAGFIGSHCIRALLDRGDSVWCLDNFNDYYSPRVKAFNVEPFHANPRFHLVKGDILDRALVDALFSEVSFDKILHLAARAGVRPSIQNPTLYIDVNVKGTTILLEAARQRGVKDFIFASSSSVYGNRSAVPFSENDPVDHPVSPYAASKKAVELMAHTYHHLYGMNCIGLRFFTVYGPSGRPDMAPFIFTRAVDRGEPIRRFGDGTTQRDYTYVDDIVQGTIAAVDRIQGFAIYNLGNNHPVSLNDFIAIVETHVGKKAIIEESPHQPGDVERTYANIEKAQRELGFQSKISFKEGMARFTRWYQEHKDLYN